MSSKSREDDADFFSFFFFNVNFITGESIGPGPPDDRWPVGRIGRQRDAAEDDLVAALVHGELVERRFESDARAVVPRSTDLERHVFSQYR